MSQERDPRLEALFAQAPQELAGEDFVAGVMGRVRARGRSVLLVRLVIVAMIVILELLLDSPLQNSVGFVNEMLATPLYEVANEWLSFALAPVNSIAGLLGLTLLGIHVIYRRVFY